MPIKQSAFNRVLCYRPPRAIPVRVTCNGAGSAQIDSLDCRLDTSWIPGHFPSLIDGYHPTAVAAIAEIVIPQIVAAALMAPACERACWLVVWIVAFLLDVHDSLSRFALIAVWIEVGHYCSSTLKLRIWMARSLASNSAAYSTIALIVTRLTMMPLSRSCLT